MRPIRLLLLLVIFAVSDNIRAQSVVVRMDTTALFQLGTDTIHLGDTLSFTVPIYDSSSVFTIIDSLEFYYSINDTIYTDDNDSSGISYPIDSLIADTTPFNTNATLRFIFNHPRFTVGPSVVVIWPIAHPAIPFVTFITDTFYRIIDILGPSGIQDPADQNMKVFIAHQQLFVAGSEANLKDLKVYDALGSLLLEKQLSLSAIIPMAQYASGIYMVEVTFADNSRRVFKVFNPGVR